MDNLKIIMNAKCKVKWIFLPGKSNPQNTALKRLKYKAIYKTDF